MRARRTFKVMLSSTFKDLEAHREVVSQALRRTHLTPIQMEDDVTLSDKDVIASSLAKVDEADAYFIVVGKRYGSEPECQDRNPNALSTTALEFARAKARGLPVAALFLGRGYPVTEDQIDFDEGKRRKLEDLRRAVQDHVIAGSVDSETAFREAVPTAAADLYRALMERCGAWADDPVDPIPAAGGDRPPPAPTLYRVRPFAQGLDFVGRAEELADVTRWAQGSATRLVVEAIGGMGKSMLAHHWLTDHAGEARPDLAGRLWYSFYEDGASMTDFCAHALAYVEGQPRDTYRGINRRDLGDRLVRRLADRPWLLVLDGLERLLLAYDRYDPAQAADEDADSAARGEDDPNLCIRPEDDALLRDLAGVDPSKLLVTSRNMPTVLLSPARRPLPYVKHLALTGLAPADAERLLRDADVRGDGPEMRDYLERHFGCHPLMVGIVAGLVNDHAPAPGDFDHWRRDPRGAQEVHLARIDGLVGKRTHVLKVAHDGLAADARKLLGRLAFFSHGVRFEVMQTLNPRRPPAPTPVPEPGDGSGTLEARRRNLLSRRLAETTDASKQAGLRSGVDMLETMIRKKVEEAREAWDAYQADLAAWKASPALGEAEEWLRAVLVRLQRSGLMMRDRSAATYDLHPLVRAFLRDAMGPDDRAETGQVVADYARMRAPSAITDASSGEDFDAFLEVARTLLLGGHVADAAQLLAEVVPGIHRRTGRTRAFHQLLSALFKPDLADFHAGVPESARCTLANKMGVAASYLGNLQETLKSYVMNVEFIIENKENLKNNMIALFNLSNIYFRIGDAAISSKLINLAKRCADSDSSRIILADFDLRRMERNVVLGRLDWRRTAPLCVLDDIDSFGGSEILKSNLALLNIVIDQLSDNLTLQRVNDALAKWPISLDRWTHRRLLLEKALLFQSQDAHDEAAGVFEEAIRIGREDTLSTEEDEARYAVSLAVLGRTDDARRLAERLELARRPPHLRLAELWLALGETEKARVAALAAYPLAWADGPPNCWYWHLQDCRAVLAAVGEPEPQLPTIDPDSLPPLPFEADVLRLIEENEARKAQEEADKNAKTRR